MSQSTNLDDLDEKEIERRFHVAVKNIQNNKETKLPFKPSTSQQLFFYGRYKQATVGDCQGEQPSLWYPVKRYMWSAHDKNRGKPKLQAMKEYVEEINKLAAEFDLSTFTPDLREVADQFFAELNGTGPYAPKTEAATTTSTSAIAAESTPVPTTITSSTITPTPTSATVTPTATAATATPTPTPTTNGHSHVHINGTSQTNGKNVSAAVAKFNGMNGVTKSNNKVNNPPSTPPSAPITTPTPNNTPATLTTPSTSTSTPNANGHTSKRSRAARRRASQTQQAQASQSQVAAASTQRYQAKTSTTSTSNNSSPALQPASTPSSISNSPSLSASTAPASTSASISTSTSQSTSSQPVSSPIPPIDTSVPTDAAALSARLLALQRENHEKLLQLEAHILNVTKKATQAKLPTPSSDSTLNDTVQQLEQKQQQRQTTFSLAEESWRNQLARIEQVQASLLDRVSHLYPRTLTHIQQTFADIPTRTRHGVELVPKQQQQEEKQQPQESFTPSSTTQAVVTVIAAATGLGVLCYAGYKTWRYVQEKRKA